MPGWVFNYPFREAPLALAKAKPGSARVGRVKSLGRRKWTIYLEVANDLLG